MNIITLVSLFSVISQTYNLPPDLLKSLCYVESTHNVYAVHIDDGGSNSIGVCQIKLPTAKLMGFRGTDKELMNVHDNVKYAAKYLTFQLRRYNGNVYKAVAAYNTGSYITHNGVDPINKPYVNKVLKEWTQAK